MLGCRKGLFASGTAQKRVGWRLLGSGRPVIKGKVSPRREVPGHIPRPPYAESGVDPMSGRVLSTFDLHGEALQKMRDACLHAKETLDYAGSLVKPGVTTDEIDRKVHEHIIRRNIYPSPLGYRGFPKSLCSSVNEVQCHGIPDDRELEEGDIVNLDVSCFVNGFHGDTSRTFRVGQVSEAAEKIIEASEDCLNKSIAACGPGVPLNTIGKIVADLCSELGYEPSRTFCGHGISSTFHCLPYVLHFEHSNPFILHPGLVFTIEPIVCEGSEAHEVWEDNWTIFSEDLGLAAQAEHTILITTDGTEILT